MSVNLVVNKRAAWIWPYGKASVKVAEDPTTPTLYFNRFGRITVTPVL